MKKMMYLLCISLIYTSGHQLDAGIIKKIRYSWAGGANTTKVGFSLHNKANNAIYITVENSTSNKKKLTRVIRGAFFEAEMNISQPTTLTIYDCKDLDSCNPGSSRVAYRATFTKNKTIFINWDGAKVYKQRGPLLGATGVTDHDYDLANNVEASDILPKK